MNKIRFGNSEISMTLWLMSVFPLIFIIMILPFTYAFLMLISIVFSFIAVIWLPMLIAKYQLRPALDKCLKNETTWCRVTQDHIIVPQFVDKGPYGQTKGITYKEKADVIDDGEFPLKWLNGNPAVLMYDMINTSIDMRKSIARKKMTKIFGIRSGIEGYKKAQMEKKIIKTQEKEQITKAVRSGIEAYQKTQKR